MPITSLVMHAQHPPKSPFEGGLKMLELLVFVALKKPWAFYVRYRPWLCKHIVVFLEGGSQVVFHRSPRQLWMATQEPSTAKGFAKRSFPQIVLQKTLLCCL